MAVVYWTPPALVTPRGPLDLLSLQEPFTQLGLLTADSFERQAEQRGIRLRVGQLQELHRLGLVVPFFQVDLTSKESNRKLDEAQLYLPRTGYSTALSELLAAAVEQRLSDPLTAGFSPWPRTRVRTLWPSFETGYLYSPHQLLQLVAARPIIDEFVLTGHDGGVPTWQLPDERIPDSETVTRLATWRLFAVILSALDTALWPSVRCSSTRVRPLTGSAWIQKPSASKPNRCWQWRHATTSSATSMTLPDELNLRPG